jgi:hypothetical protein
MSEKRLSALVCLGGLVERDVRDHMLAGLLVGKCQFQFVCWQRARAVHHYVMIGDDLVQYLKG